MGRPKPKYDDVYISWQADLLAKCIAVICAISFSAFLLLVIAVTDPVTVDLLGRFVPKICSTVRSIRTRGATICASWTSCRRNCADPPALYSCIHIHVTVLDNTDMEHVQSPLIMSNSSFFEFDMSEQDRYIDVVNITTTRLLVNAAGCGYELNCSTFFDRFGELGAEFPCLYSEHLNRAIPMDARLEPINPWGSILIPFAPLLLSAVCLAFLCVKGFCDFPRLVPKHVLIRLLLERRKKVTRTIKLMQRQQQQQRIETPLSQVWRKVSLQHVRVEAVKKMEDDLVLQPV